MKIKTGDNVKLLAGKDKRKTGTVLQVFPKLNKVVVEGLNMTVKHLKGNSQQKGKTIDYPAPINVSNVALVGKDATGRVGYEIKVADGKTNKYRIVNKAGKQTRVQ